MLSAYFSAYSELLPFSHLRLLSWSFSYKCPISCDLYTYVYGGQFMKLITSVYYNISKIIEMKMTLIRIS